uniref:Uncharacterized protein n=1 Tax=Oryza meridionalis TaxID=40149 RepID=A0A0E0DII5_9ORYZ
MDGGWQEQGAFSEERGSSSSSKGWRSGLESRGEYSYGANLHAGPYRLRNVRCVSYFWGCIMLLRARPDGLYSPSKSSPWNYPIIHTFELIFILVYFPALSFKLLMI